MEEGRGRNIQAELREGTPPQLNRRKPAFISWKQTLGNNEQRSGIKKALTEKEEKAG